MNQMTMHTRFPDCSKMYYQALGDCGVAEEAGTDDFIRAKLDDLRMCLDDLKKGRKLCEKTHNDYDKWGKAPSSTISSTLHNLAQAELQMEQDIHWVQILLKFQKFTEKAMSVSDFNNKMASIKANLETVLDCARCIKALCK